MVSVELGDLEPVALKNCNGNLSKYIRELVSQDNNKKIESNRIYLLQLLCFLFLGITLFVFAIDISIELPTLLLNSLMIFSGILLIMFSLFSYKRSRSIKMEVA